MRIDRLLVVSVLALCMMTGCKGKKADNPSKPAAMQAHPVSSLS
jgi:hypothetical protein